MRNDEFKPISALSRAISTEVERLMDENGISQTALGAAMPTVYKQAYISDRLRGARPINTDMIDALARLIGAEPRTLLRSIVETVRDAGLVEDATTAAVEGAQTGTRSPRRSTRVGLRSRDGSGESK